MRLTEHEQERLLITVAADVAERRRGRGLQLNHPEAVAILTSFVLEGARDGRTVAELMSAGREVLTPRRRHGRRARDARLGAGRGDLPRRHQAGHRPPADPVTVTEPQADPGRDAHRRRARSSSTPGRPRVELTVENTGDRPIQVGSHYHFAAANPALSFDRAAAWGYRLDIPAGTSVRFEPGMSREVVPGRAGRARGSSRACGPSRPGR